MSNGGGITDDVGSVSVGPPLGGVIHGAHQVPDQRIGRGSHPHQYGIQVVMVVEMGLFMSNQSATAALVLHGHAIVELAERGIS